MAMTGAGRPAVERGGLLQSLTRRAGTVASNPWARFVARRLGMLVIMLVVLVVLTFALVRLLPGNPAGYILGFNATPAAVKAFNHQFGLDRPLIDQFGTYFWNTLHLNFGKSLETSQPVSQLISQRLPKSAELAFIALAVILIISVPLGICMGSLTRDGRHKRIDVVFTTMTSLFASIPQFLMATVLIVIFSVWIGWLPVIDDGTAKSLILPVAAIALAPTLGFARFVRIETLNVLAQDYIRTARSKRMSSLRLYGRHVLPNVLTAALTFSGLVFTGLIAGTVLIETVFARLGLGTALVSAVQTKDYPVVQGVTFVLGVVVVVVNMLVDIAQAMLDPRSIIRRA